MSSASVSQREFARRAGCDDKQVRRAVASGKLRKNEDGTIDLALLESGWRRPIKSSKGIADNSKASARTSAPDIEITGDESPAAMAAKIVLAMGADMDLAEAIRVKENYNAQLQRLKFEEADGKLVDLQLAQKILFDGGRAGRDAWMNWPARKGPLIAADLGLDADRVVEVLTGYVHDQVAELGEPESNFASG